MKKWIALLFAVTVLLTPCLAAELAGQAEDYGGARVEEALPDSARDILGDAGVSDTLDTPGFLARIWEVARERLGEILTRGARSAVSIVAIALLCGLASAVAEGEAPRYVLLGGVLAVAVVAAGDAGVFLTGGQTALQEISDFSHALLPCMTAAAAAGGAVTSAAAKYATTALFMDIFITAAQGLVLPLIYAYIASAVAAAAMESPALESAASLLKWLCTTAMTLLVTAFTLYLTLTGVVTGSADALTAKAAKTALGAALPVVGGIMSDAASAVVAGAGMVRGAVGVFGLAATLCICLVPFLRLGVQYLLYKAAAALSGAFAEKRLGSLIGSLGSAFGMMLGMVGSGALMLFFSILSLIKAVNV